MCQPHASRNPKGKGHRGSAGESRQGLAGGGSACKDLILLVNQMQLLAAPLPRDDGEAVFQVWFLERDQFEVLLTIPPVDPPGQAVSESSVAVVDHYGFTILHGVVALALVRSAVARP